MNTRELMFELPGVGGWEVRVQATFIAPLAPPDATLPTTGGQVAEPRANVVVSRAATAEPDAMSAYRTFVGTTAAMVPGLEVVSEPAPFPFGDAIVGIAAVVSFPATEHIALMQLHVFRLDDGLLTQIVATMDAAEGYAALDAWASLIHGFVPTAPRPG